MRDTSTLPSRSMMGKLRQNLTLLMKISSASLENLMIMVLERSQELRPSRCRRGKV